MIAINLGCGRNHIEGWKNYDADVDITKPLPFHDQQADFVLAEHVVEHVGYYEAVAFFRECFRILKPDGVLRIAVPSIERVMQHGNDEYFKFVAKKWAPTPDRRGAMHAMLHAHGHRAPWTEGLLLASVYFAGFDKVRTASPGMSKHPELRGVEGHGRVIGDEFNEIETVIVEGTK